MYVKLYSSILDSSVWAESPETRIVWVTLLAMCDQDGFVRCAPTRLASRANVSQEACEAAIAILESPDTHSGNPENGGRRITRISAGWQILNYAHYRTLQDPDIRRLQVREAVTRHRDKKSSVINGNHPVIIGNQLKSPVIIGNQLKAEAEAEAEAKNIYTDGFDAFWAVYPRRAGANPKVKAKEAFAKRVEEGVPIIDLQDGAARYAAFLAATGKVNTEFVKQAVAWLSPTYRGWEETWLPPADDGDLPAFPNYPTDL